MAFYGNKTWTDATNPGRPRATWNRPGHLRVREDPERKVCDGADLPVVGLQMTTGRKLTGGQAFKYGTQRLQAVCTRSFDWIDKHHDNVKDEIGRLIFLRYSLGVYSGLYCSSLRALSCESTPDAPRNFCSSTYALLAHQTAIHPRFAPLPIFHDPTAFVTSQKHRRLQNADISRSEDTART